MTRIHVNRNAIDRNRSDGGRRPVITVRDAEGVRDVYEVEILGPSRVVYRPGENVTVWIETESDVSLEQSPPSA